jgi:hypothetical protein
MAIERQSMAMARKREKKEKGIAGQLLGNVSFKGLAHDGAAVKGGIIKQLTGRMPQRALNAETAGRLGYEVKEAAAAAAGAP